jgi:hypothetical protein
MIRSSAIAIGRRIWPVLLATALILGMSAFADGASAATSHTPVGRLDSVAQSGTGIAVGGWALDPDITGAIHVDVYLDGHGTRLKANTKRRDVARTHRGYGAYHGFRAFLATGSGTHTVCAHAINAGPGSRNTFLGCRTLTVKYNPFGAITTVKQYPGGTTITGWAVDHDQPLPALAVKITVDDKLVATHVANLPRPDVAKRYPSAGAAHGFSFAPHAAAGVHTICLIATNIGRGSNATVACEKVTLNFSPVGAITSLTQVPGGVRVQGWAQDPDTAAPVTVLVYADGTKVGTLSAKTATHGGHGFNTVVPLGTGTIPPGAHTICVSGTNLGTYGATRSLACMTKSMTFRPVGAFEHVSRSGSTHLSLTGWAIDPDVAHPIAVKVSIDGASAPGATANVVRTDIGIKYPGYGRSHGLSDLVTVSSGEHKVCLTAVNVGNGTGSTSLGCRVINAVHPVAPSAPRSVKAVGGYSSAKITWTAPASDGGAPWTKYTVTASPGGRSVTVAAGSTSATIGGLKTKTYYAFTVLAHNLAGRSAAGRSAAIRTASVPPPQTSPAPISTSRYIRNIHGASATDLAQMRREGVADAGRNPAGHRYLILLDIGGQDHAHNGVVLSATTRFVSNANLVRDLNAYVDGYASTQKSGAPAMIALGTNNDMDVSKASGAAWARNVVNPVRAHAARHAGLSIAGANDIEPGFRGSYAQSKAWLTGYLGATSAKFVFNGSADGCAWAATARACNNGWSMAGLYQLSAGAAPSRIVNLPQVYNNTMAAQWKFISLTGVAAHHPEINFGGALTEWTACAQVGGCGSLTGRNAWIQMWHQLQSHPALRPHSLPYATDLRIDR